MRTALAIAVLVVLLAAARARAEEPPSWARTEAGVVERLAERDIGAWARELEDTPVPDDAAGLFIRISVLVRAGHLGNLDRELDALGALPAETQRREGSGVVESLMRRGEALLARHLLERVPHAQASYADDLLGSWPRGTPAAEIDAWIAARERVDAGAWSGLRVHFLESRKALAPYVAALAEAVRAKSSDLAAIQRYLHAQARLDRNGDVSWLVETAKPRLAVSCHALGHALLGWPGVAASYFERALALPFTDEDAEALPSVITSRAPARRPSESEFRGSVKHALMRAYLAAGDATKAQALLLELTAAFPDGLPPPDLSREAGAIQGASGARVIEGRIRDAEVPNETSVAYWATRAEYFVGRNERGEADAAFLKALALTGEPGREAVRAGAGPGRGPILRGYVSWLGRTGRRAEGSALLWREYEAADPTSPLAEFVLGDILEGRAGAVEPTEPDDERLWRFLEANAEWDASRAGTLLRRMAASNPTTAFWDRAEALTREAAPGRALALGRILCRAGALRRGLPLLEDAAARLTQAGPRATAAWELFEAHLGLDDWRNAEARWADVKVRVAWPDRPRWLGRIALAAARSGARAEALRLWAVRTNLDRGDMQGLDDLANAGLRDDLVAFYGRMAQADPTTVYPARMLRRLGAGK